MESEIYPTHEITNIVNLLKTSINDLHVIDLVLDNFLNRVSNVRLNSKLNILQEIFHIVVQIIEANDQELNDVNPITFKCFQCLKKMIDIDSALINNLNDFLIHKLIEILSEKGSKNEKIVQECIAILTAKCEFDILSLLRLIPQQKIIAACIHKINHPIHFDEIIIFHSLSILQTIGSLNDDNVRKSMIDGGMISQICNIIQIHETNSKILSKALELLAVLCENQSGLDEFLEMNGVRTLFHLTKRNMINVEVNLKLMKLIQIINDCPIGTKMIDNMYGFWDWILQDDGARNTILPQSKEIEKDKFGMLCSETKIKPSDYSNQLLGTKRFKTKGDPNSRLRSRKKLNRRQRKKEKMKQINQNKIKSSDLQDQNVTLDAMEWHHQP